MPCSRAPNGRRGGTTGRARLMGLPSPPDSTCAGGKRFPGFRPPGQGRIHQRLSARPPSGSSGYSLTSWLRRSLVSDAGESSGSRAVGAGAAGAAFGDANVVWGAPRSEHRCHRRATRVHVPRWAARWAGARYCGRGRAGEGWWHHRALAHELVSVTIV